MNNIMLFDKSIPEIGLKVRKPRNGPEYQLVERFLDYKIKRFESRKNPKTKLAVFFEPFLESGFPDLVFSEYDPRRFDQWSDNRFKLNVGDIKIFYHILHSRGNEGMRIQQQLGIESKLLLVSIEKLLDAGLIVRRLNQWHAKQFTEIFGIKKLIAVEAKINNWTEVFNQAHLNKWFSSESYALSSVVQPAEKNLKRSELLGVGIYVSNHKVIKKIRPSSLNSVPSSYASLMFNEWIGRRLSLTR